MNTTSQTATPPSTTDDQSIQRIYPFFFQVPLNSTLGAAAEPIKMRYMSHSLLETLNEENWGMPKTVGILGMGLYDMGIDFSIQEVPARIAILAKAQGRNIRLGTPEEAFHFKTAEARISQGRPLDTTEFIVPSKVLNSRVVHWHQDRFTMTLNGRGKWYHDIFKIFVVLPA
ncbi:MAG: hypothetical protein AAB511_03275 [Patescibacteria group bacterium]